MDEEKETPQEEVEKAASDTGVGDKPTEDSIIARADATAQRMEEANKKAEEILERQERLSARNLLGGSTEAGQTPVAEKEESPKDYAKRALAGEFNAPIEK